MKASRLVGFLFLSISLSSLHAQTVLDTQLVANGFTQPLYLTAPPGDFSRLFVVEQPGRIKIFKNGATLPAPFLDITGPVLAGGERGLLGLAFHPSYASNGFFFVNYTRDPDGATVVARYSVSAGNPDLADAGSAVTLLTIAQPFANHNGGCLQFGPKDGYLYIGMGDGGSGNDPMGNGQNTGTLLGKMLRVDVDGGSPYAIPPSNPFVGPGNPLDEIWALGLRNPWRFSFDRLNGDLYIADVGQNAREEIDYQRHGALGGKNYGWRCMEGTLCTGLSGCICNAPALTPPIHEYAHSGGNCSVTGGYVYRGCAIPDLRGTYFFADFCSAKIWSFKYAGGAVTQFADRTAELAPGGGLSINSISSFGEDANGELYIVDQGGEIFKIVPQTTVLTGLGNFGAGTPGCLGSQALSANCCPTLHNPGFQLVCTNAPANALGLGIITNLSSPGGGDPFAIGIEILLDLGLSTEIYTADFLSDASGLGRAAVPIPNSTALIGATYHAQAIWAWGGVPCSLPPFGLSSSNGLSITIQP